MYLLPQPKSVTEGRGVYRLAYKGDIRLGAGCSAAAYDYAKLLKEEIMQAVACDFSITTTTCASEAQAHKNSIMLTMEAQPAQMVQSAQMTQGSVSDTPSLGTRVPTPTPESYHLSITTESVRLTGYGEAGLLYGVQTLRQLIRQYGTGLPVVEIADEPAIANRGFYQDVSRGRIPTLAELKRLADVCSFYKINQLQLYVEHSYLFEGFSETWREDTPLTAEEIMEFDAYCAALHIDLVPSLSSFGHLYGVLRTKQYGHLSELADERKGYFMHDRMAHHTVDVTNEESFAMVCRRIMDYVKLFRSDKFNICADETFDLGKGKSKAVADEKGVTEIYLAFLNRLCETVIAAGKTPMFWGDIILKNPENIKRLPAEAVCLNWEYDPDVKEDNTRTFVEAGAKHLYVCPGVQSWLWLINKHRDAYRNISGMCRLAHKYKVEGVLNTCWGDLGHIAHSEFSTIGLIYGAAFSWSKKEVAEADINSAISVLAYGDRTGGMVQRLADLSALQTVNWWHVVEFKESMQKGAEPVACCERLLKQDIASVRENVEKMEAAMQELYDGLITIDSAHCGKIVANLLMAKGQTIWAKVCVTVADAILQCGNPFCKGTAAGEDGACDTLVYPAALAAELEDWLYDYKKLWRSVTKESELHRLVDVACWYADYLRDL